MSSLTYSNISQIFLNYNVVSSQYVCKYKSYLSLFSSIVKAYSLGTFICHTTDILSDCFFYIVHWIKPPFLNIIHFLWIGYIIPLQPIFVNTILKFYIFNLFIHLYIYNFLIFVFISHNLHNISILIVNLVFYMVDKLFFIPYTTN